MPLSHWLSLRHDNGAADLATLTSELPRHLWRRRSALLSPAISEERFDCATRRRVARQQGYVRLETQATKNWPSGEGQLEIENPATSAPCIDCGTNQAPKPKSVGCGGSIQWVFDAFASAFTRSTDKGWSSPA